MDRERMLRRKWTLRAHDRQIVLVKRANEQSVHVLLKAFLWALYLPSYPDLTVEIAIGDRYKPDLVALDSYGVPKFWGEAGQLGLEKIRSIVRRYRSTHFAIAKWNTALSPFREIVKKTLDGVERKSPLDLLCFPDDSIERFIDERGEIHIKHDFLEWVRFF